MISLFHTTLQKNSIAVLDGVRAIACLLVIIYHVNIQAIFLRLWPRDVVGPIVTSWAVMGWTGVTLFFILSGFLLFMPYMKSLLLDRQWPSMRLFYLRRILRILPAYYVSLFLLVVFVHPEYLQPQRWRELLLFVFFFMDSDKATFQQLNGPYWTLAVEWQFYMLLPFLAPGFRWLMNRFARRWRIGVLLLCLSGMIAWGLLTRYWGSYYVAHPTETLVVPRSVFNYVLFFVYGVSGKFFEDFAIGMLLCLCYVYTGNAANEHWLSIQLRRYAPYIGGAGLLWLFFMVAWPAFPSLMFLEPFIARNSWLCEIGFAFGYGLCILALLFGSWRMKRPLEWAPLCGVGQLSYSLYIWHLPILFAFMAYVLPLVQNWHDAIVYTLFWVCIVVVVFPFCYAFYRLIELPWMKRGSKLHEKGYQENKSYAGAKS